jgi:hypothetical protein
LLRYIIVSITALLIGLVALHYRQYHSSSYRAKIDEEHNYKEKNAYFSNMKKIIKHYPMTDRLIVRRGYLFNQ